MKKFTAVLLSTFFAINGSAFVLADNTVASYDILDLSDNNIPENLQNIILMAKSKIDIPEDYSEFEYDINVRGKGKTDIYTLTWSKKYNENNKDEYFNPIMINIDPSGNIYYYSFYKETKGNSSLQNKKTKAERLEAAQNFLKKILPNNYSEFKFDENEQNYNTFVFRQYKNDAPVRFNSITIDVNPDNLHINNYNFENADCLNADLQSTENIMEVSEAKEKFKTAVDFKPEYIFNYDYKTEETKTFLAYDLDKISNKSIDANDGTLFKRDTYISYAKEEATTDSAKLSEGGSGDFLTQKEASEIEKSKNLISKEEADSLIKSILPGIFDNCEAEAFDLRRDTIDKEQYIWYITYANGDASIDARTKELQSFDNYTNNYFGIDSDLIDEEKRIKADEFIKKVAPNKFDSFKLSEEESSNFNLRYIRIVNDLEFRNNMIRVSFDKDNNITSYYMNWYNSINFEPPENIIDASQILDKVEEIAGFGPVYEINSNFQNEGQKIALCYSFINNSEFPPLISATTGKEITYTGSDYERDFKAPESYPDISGHWCEKYVTALLNNGVFVKRNEFLPDEKITKDDFFEYYREYRFNDFITDNFKDKKDFISKREMAKTVTKMLECNKIAEKNDIFKNTFNDIDENDKDLGSMVICDALDIINADENGNFNPDEDITNAEAAKIIFTLSNIDYEKIDNLDKY